MIAGYIERTFAVPVVKWIKRIAIALLILWTVLPSGVMRAPMQVTDTTDSEWHGVVVKPAIVAASKVPAGVIAQIDLTINIAAEHEQGTVVTSHYIRKASEGADNPQIGNTVTPECYIKYAFTKRGGGQFDTNGAIDFNPWSIPLIIQQLTDGSYKILTDEDGVSFTVKSAVAVKPPFKPRWTLDYQYGFNGTHTIMPGKELTSWLAVKGGVEFGAGQVEGKVGGQIIW